MSFCVAPVARPAHVSAKVSKVVFCNTRNTRVSFSEDELQFSWQVQHFGDLHRHLASQAQHFSRVSLRDFCESHCQGCVKRWQHANCVAGVEQEFTLYTLHLTLHTLHCTLHTPHFTLYTQHSALHCKLYTLQSTLYTPHFPPYSPHFQL